MRILVLVTDAFGGRGGIAKFNRDLLCALTSYPGCEEVLALPRVMFGASGMLPPRLTWRGDVAGAKLHYTWCALRSALNSWPRDHTVDLIVCGHLNLLPLACVARALTRGDYIPLAVVIHGIEAWGPRRGPIWRRWLRQSDAVVSVSEFTRKRFMKWSGLQRRPVFIVRNSVDRDRFKPGPRNEKLAQRYGVQGKRVLLTLARLEPAERYKGIDEVLGVMPRLVRELPGICYVIAGEGNDRARLVAKARGLGLRVAQGACGHGSADVVFAGHISEEEKVEHYRLADAFVMPGCGEGFGIVYLEALACGVPVVGSKLDASGELLAGCEMSFVVDPHEPNEVWEGIRRALAHPRGRVPETVREYSIDLFVSQVHGMLDELVMPAAWKGQSSRQHAKT